MLAWLRPDETDHSEPQGAPGTLGSVAAGTTTVAREIPGSGDEAREHFKSMAMAEKMKLMMPVMLKMAQVDSAYCQPALMADLGASART